MSIPFRGAPGASQSRVKKSHRDPVRGPTAKVGAIRNLFGLTTFWWRVLATSENNPGASSAAVGRQFDTQAAHHRPQKALPRRDRLQHAPAAEFHPAVPQTCRSLRRRSSTRLKYGGVHVNVAVLAQRLLSRRIQGITMNQRS